MINTSRQIDLLLFSVNEDLTFNDTKITQGMNQIRREDGQYNIYKLDSLHLPYTYIFLDEMPTLLKTVYKNLINDGGITELEDPTVVHCHEKIKAIGNDGGILKLVSNNIEPKKSSFKR